MRIGTGPSANRPKPYRTPGNHYHRHHAPTNGEPSEPKDESLFVKVTTILNIVVTSVLAIAAIVFGSIYNARENSREAEKFKYERIQSILASRQQCADVQLTMPTWARSIETLPQGNAVLKTISYYDSMCKSAGFPLSRDQIQEVAATISRLKIISIKKDVDQFLARSSQDRRQPSSASALANLKIARQATIDSIPTQNLKLSPGFTSLERFIIGAQTAERARTDPGTGVNWDSPFGPVRIDIGKVLSPSTSDDAKVVEFNSNTQF